MNKTQRWAPRLLFTSLFLVLVLTFGRRAFAAYDSDDRDRQPDVASRNAQRLVDEGRQTFRYDTFGDEAFWGGALKLHTAVQGLSPATALAVGLKVDIEALPKSLITALRNGTVDLNAPATTMALLKLNAVVGVTGTFSADGITLTSMGIQCALCHSTVDNSFTTSTIAPGLIGKRQDGWANRDLNVGEIINLSPDLSVPEKVLGVNDQTLRAVLESWGPGKFDAEVFMDGRAFGPTGASGATLIPPAYGLAGFNLHTWTGWGSVTYWNAFVANLEMHGQGRFFDSRLNNAAQFPVAVKNGFNNVQIDPSLDKITPKLAALHVYQLAIPAPKLPADPTTYASSTRGAALFNGTAQCATCHTPPLFTEPGWNAHTPADICVDDFQASRSPDHIYRTAPLAGLFAHQKGGFYHDGRFATLLDVVNHYDSCKSLQLTDTQKSDLVQYLLTL